MKKSQGREIGDYSGSPRECRAGAPPVLLDVCLRLQSTRAQGVHHLPPSGLLHLVEFSLPEASPTQPLWSQLCPKNSPPLLQKTFINCLTFIWGLL